MLHSASNPTPTPTPSTSLSFEDLVFAKSSPGAFLNLITKGSGTPWRPAEHLLKINDVLVDVRLGRTKRVIIEVAPQHGKSELASAGFPAWYVGLHPDRWVAIASYQAGLANRFGRKARDYLLEWGPKIFGTQIRKDITDRGDWETTRGGGVFSAGVGGPFTGRGISVGIVDDPVKNYEEGNSETVKESVWDWYTSSFVTRLRPDGVIIIIMARWSEDDLAGRAMANWESEGIPYVRIRIPAFAEEGDILGRKPGEALWPVLDGKPWRDAKFLNQTKGEMGGPKFNALYQCSPNPPGGAIFRTEWFRNYRRKGDYLQLLDGPRAVASYDINRLYIFQIVDLAISEKETSDYFVITTWARGLLNELILLDVFRERM